MMNKTFLRALLSLTVIFSLPRIASAAIPPKVLTFVGNIYAAILNPIIVLLFALSFTYFMYGIVNFVWNGESADVREKGRSGMIWGIVGMFIMFSVFGILRILINTFGGDESALLGGV